MPQDDLTDEQRQQILETIKKQPTLAQNAVHKVMLFLEVKKLLDKLARENYLSETEVEECFYFYHKRIHSMLTLAICDECGDSYGAERVRYLAVPKGMFICPSCAEKHGI